MYESLFNVLRVNVQVILNMSLDLHICFDPTNLGNKTGLNAIQLHLCSKKSSS